MHRPLLVRIALVAGVVLSGLMLHVVKGSHGQSAVNHIVGGLLIVIAVILAFRPRIPVYSGFRHVGDLTGWHKAIVVLPISVLSLFMLAS